MARQEHIALDQSSTYFLYGLFGEQKLSRPKRLTGWKTFYTSLRNADTQNADIMLADAVSRTIEERGAMGKRKGLRDFIVFVGHQGSGKDYVAGHMRRNGYTRITMSDIVRSIAPALGFDPNTTQGKIDAGHAMRRIFGKGVFVDLGVREATENRKRRIIMTGPRSSLEIRTARKYGARIVSLITDKDAGKDRAIRMDRVIQPRKQGDTVRVMTKADFLSREHQEKRRINRLMQLADRTVVNNRAVKHVIAELL